MYLMDDKLLKDAEYRDEMTPLYRMKKAATMLFILSLLGRYGVMMFK